MNIRGRSVVASLITHGDSRKVVLYIVEIQSTHFACTSICSYTSSGILRAKLTVRSMTFCARRGLKSGFGLVHDQQLLLLSECDARRT